MTAGGDDYIVRLLPYHSFIFLFNYRCADRSFLNIVKAELLESLPHCADTHALVVCNKRRSKADKNGIAALQKHLNLFCLVNDLLCVLRTDNEALTAQNALIADDMRLIAGNTNGFHGAMPDAFIAVFAVGFF